MRDSVDVTNFDHYEVSPLLPDPPVQVSRVKQKSNCCHSCWQHFTCCSKWLCALITLLLIVLILIIVRSVLPFGWPWWIPAIEYDASDPHIILIVADDIGWGDLGYGGAEYPTTNIDALKQSGIALNRFYAHESGSATRSALLTGVPGYAMGLQNGIDTGSSAHIPLDVTLLPELLRGQRGYATHMVGKWSLGYSRFEYTPTRRGFDTFLGFHQRYIDYWHYSATIEERLDADSNVQMVVGYDMWQGEEVFQPEVKMQYATELFDDHISSLIDDHVNGEHPDQPMFLMYAPPQGHAPIQYHFEYDAECSYIRETGELIRTQYCNLMQELDQSVGRLVGKLKQNNMWQRTLLVFTTDNGGLMCWDVGGADSCSGSVNLPLRGGKGTLFEGSIRVRSLLSGGYLEESARGQEVDELMHATDLFATLAEAAHVEPSQVYGVETLTSWDAPSQAVGMNEVTGLSFWDRLTGKTDSSPLRETPFIADMKLDDSSSYIQKVAVFWQGYKYVAQPAEAYDGWWRSPLQGSSDLPADSIGVVMQPQPLNGGGETTEVQPQTGLSAVLWDTLRVNEYLFKIGDDPAETKNIGGSEDEDIQALLTEFRTYLRELAGAPRRFHRQESGTSFAADPAKYGGVWYPFEQGQN